MPDSTLPKPTPPVSDDTSTSVTAEPLKMTAQGEIVVDTKSEVVPAPNLPLQTALSTPTSDTKSTDDKKPDDDLSVPPSAFQTAPPAPLPPPSLLPLTAQMDEPAPVTLPPPLSAGPFSPSLPPQPTGGSATVSSIMSTPPPTTLTALSSMTSASVPPTPPPSPTKTTQAQPKVQPILATAPKKSSRLPLLLGLGVLLLLVIGAAAFFLLKPKTTSVANTTPKNKAATDDQNSGAGTGTSSGAVNKNGTAGGNQPGTNPAGSSATQAPSNQTSGTGSSGEPVVLEYWGLWEPEELMREVLTQYQTIHPGVSVRYTKQSYQDYRERLQTAIASGNGPDLFRFHASWTPMLKNELSPMPATIMSTDDFSHAFLPIVSTQLQQNGQIVGIPLMYDGLILYYNKDIFKTAGVDPPQTWADVRTLASKLAIRNSAGGLQRGGIAMGNVSNVEHFSDILGVLLLQNGADLTRPNSTQTRDALLFYTNFVTKDKVWDDQLPSSTLAFSRGDVAMMFAPSWRAHDIAAQNPSLQFGTVPLPKLSENRLTWATYWAEGVSQKSKNKQAAWELLKYLSSSEVIKSQYAKAGAIRGFGEIYPRKDIAVDLANTEVVKSVLEDAPYAQNWYLNSYTHDNGINDKLIQYYTDAVNGILSGKKPEEMLVTLEQGTAQVLGQYDIGLSL